MKKETKEFVGKFLAISGIVSFSWSVFSFIMLIVTAVAYPHLTNQDSAEGSLYKKSARQRLLLMVNSPTKKEFLDHWMEVHDFLLDYPLPKTSYNSNWSNDFFEIKRIIEKTSDETFKDYKGTITALLMDNQDVKEPDYGLDQEIINKNNSTEGKFVFWLGNTGSSLTITLILCFSSLPLIPDSWR